MPDGVLPPRIRKLPRAPASNDCPEDIKGNFLLEMRQLAIPFMYFTIADFLGSVVIGIGHVFLRDIASRRSASAAQRRADRLLARR
ncbi:uncharacterized protein LAESUDRAFT_724795 [Laetiporus sulphureus 93-53]|uniref:Uncharacterized protein n=1 Tax=Laetiporus sulphureus 93-53 TaxID=1314785 RepID=A0A165EUP4_9APHY|nr:uncharacterized protein LAESUDRAFT_724795 [Laetiporus sulphureus 93-53]KZT07799.1 hypothetical protein LAESUDRAFT_724795 [Laetiporus sulphureus 93-53]